jgi:putative membrane protein
MYAARNLSLSFIIRFAWKPLLAFFIYSSILTILYEVANFKLIAIPFAPIGLVGTAVAFYVALKITRRTKGYGRHAKFGELLST